MRRPPLPVLAQLFTRSRPRPHCASAIATVEIYQYRSSSSNDSSGSRGTRKDTTTTIATGDSLHHRPTRILPPPSPARDPIRRRALEQRGELPISDDFYDLTNPYLSRLNHKRARKRIVHREGEPEREIEQEKYKEREKERRQEEYEERQKKRDEYEERHKKKAEKLGSLLKKATGQLAEARERAKEQPRTLRPRSLFGDGRAAENTTTTTTWTSGVGSNSVIRRTFSNVRSEMEELGERSVVAPIRTVDKYKYIIRNIQQATETVRLFKLAPQSLDAKLEYKPGQWVDFHVPGIEKPGGFTMTSWPDKESEDKAYIDLAIQRSPENPVAQWLWRTGDATPEGAEVQVRVGGSFTYPPSDAGVASAGITDVVFVCGGVGINPFMSMISYMYHNGILTPENKTFQNASLLYSSSADSPKNILFLPNLQQMLRSASPTVKLSVDLFLTRMEKDKADIDSLGAGIRVNHRRMSGEDMLGRIGEDKRDRTLLYICGPQAMTDELVELARGRSGLEKDRILFEKWW